MKRRTLLLLVLFVISFHAFAQVSTSTITERQAGSRYSFLSVNLLPFVSVPIGEDSTYFGIGAGTGVNLELKIPSIPFLYTGGQFDYSYTTTPDPSTSLSTFGLSALLGLNIQFSSALNLRIFGSGGWFFSFINDVDSSGNHPYLGGGLRFTFDLSDTWGLGAVAMYRFHSGLMNDITFSLVGTYKIPAFDTANPSRSLPPGFTPLQNSSRGLSIVGIKASPIFPVFAKYYDSHPFAEIMVRNFESIAAESISAAIVIKDYMDNARSCTIPVRIEAGSESTVQLFALFNDRIFSIDESTKLTVTLVLQYT